MSESERLARLREQDRHTTSAPRVVEDLMHQGQLDPSRLEEAERLWLEARQQVAGTGSFPAAERLYYLTVLLTPLKDGLEERAMLETAIEVLTDEGHQHVIRCMMARTAAAHGDLAAAEEWLSPVQQRPLDLQMDTAYRLAAATLATVGERFSDVLALLGSREGDVPFADQNEFACRLLRINALPHSGASPQAIAELAQWTQKIGTARLQYELDLQKP